MRQVQDETRKAYHAIKKREPTFKNRTDLSFVPLRKVG